MRLPAAAIDLGTNTARLLIGYVESSGNIRRIVEKRRMTRLGGRFTREEGIDKEARERSMAAMVDFAEEMERQGVTSVRAVATSAVRDAVNGKSFCDEIHSKTSIRLEVIDSRTEGLLTLRGVFAGLDNTSGDVLVFDIGGGSTEYTLTLNGKLLFTESLALGVVRLTEGERDLIPMEGKISRELTALKTRLGNAGFLDYINKVTLIGTAGTATTLAAISMKLTEYDYRKVNNYTLSLHEIMRIFALLYPMSAEERLHVPGLEKGREDLIIAGILLTLKTMETFEFSQLKVSDFGLLEGVLLSV
jgi:exopolyphosphatase/guanosine-5'-triphosphate,3'-diphosphate pyrophosphatase